MIGNNMFTIACDKNFAKINPALDKLKTTLSKAGMQSKVYHFDNCPDDLDMVVIHSDSEVLLFSGISMNRAVRHEGYEIRKAKYNDKPTLFILAPDKTGAMYGILDVLEQIHYESVY
jgi:alpha-glucuronidase